MARYQPGTLNVTDANNQDRQLGALRRLLTCYDDVDTEYGNRPLRPSRPDGGRTSWRAARTGGVDQTLTRINLCCNANRAKGGWGAYTDGGAETHRSTVLMMLAWTMLHTWNTTDAINGESVAPTTAGALLRRGAGKCATGGAGLLPLRKIYGGFVRRHID